MKMPKELAILIGLLLIMVFASLYLQHCREPQTPTPPFTNPDIPIKSEYGYFYHVNPESNNKQIVIGLQYQTESIDDSTNNIGQYNYIIDKSITFKIGESIMGSLIAQAETLHSSLGNPTTTNNISHFLITVDSDDNPDTITIPPEAYNIQIDFTQPNELFKKALAFELNRVALTDISPSGFVPSLGINLESPQAEADMIGQSMPFVDIFRTARPFPEFSCEDVEYDENGWPTVIPNSCGAEKARTLMLQSLPSGSVPFGKYTVLYDGKGKIQYGGSAKLISSHPNKGYDVIRFDPEMHRKTNRLILTITKTSASPNHLKNIRIVMPGGICEGNPYLRVENETFCKENNFVSFVDLLRDDRNKIIFNPDYLRFLKDFRVLRTMNFMEASPRRPNRHYIPLCENLSEEEYLNCVTQTIDWSQRAKMDDATWGGSFRTIVTKRHGVPLEVAVELANQLNADPWFNIIHSADDDYVRQYASYVRDNLKEGLKAYIEYSNETWNTGFWGAHYVQAMGYKNGMDTPIYPFRDADYSARVRYYSKRSVEIFKIWEDVFGGTDRIVRIIGSNQTSTPTSKDILEYKNAYKHVDAIAIGPYFYGCWNREAEQCADTTLIPEVLSEAETVDDVFKIFRHSYAPNVKDFKQRGDPYGIASIINLIKRQVAIAKEFNVDLFAYEGGQHLNVRWREDVEKYGKSDAHLRKIYEQVNRDPRMKELYLELLRGWKDAGGKLFVMFTMPQTFHKWGSFGIKEHLNAPREESPKYDAAITLQEEAKKPWW